MHSYQIQKAGLSFYSYEILIRVLRGRDRRIFMIIFWIMIAIITIFRCVICVSRVQDIMQNSTGRTNLIAICTSDASPALLLSKCSAPTSYCESFFSQVKLSRDQFENWPIQISNKEHRNTACRINTHWYYESNYILVSDDCTECHKHVRAS
jgi:hypothetical protein